MERCPGRAGKILAAIALCGLWIFRESHALLFQAPMFAVNRAIELHLPTSDTIHSSTPVKMQLAYDHEKFVSEWLTLSDGKVP